MPISHRLVPVFLKLLHYPDPTPLANPFGRKADDTRGILPGTAVRGESQWSMENERHLDASQLYG